MNKTHVSCGEVGSFSLLVVNYFVQVVVNRSAVVGSRKLQRCMLLVQYFSAFWLSLKPLWITALYRCMVVTSLFAGWYVLGQAAHSEQEQELLSFIVLYLDAWGPVRGERRNVFFHHFLHELFSFVFHFLSLALAICLPLEYIMNGNLWCCMCSSWTAICFILWMFGWKFD